MTVASDHSIERSVHKTDRLSIDAGAQLAAQLTYLIRGVLYEGFDAARSARKDRRR
jgi:uncharacterized protein (DUF2267 family)